MFKSLMPVLLAMAALPAGATTVYTTYADMTNANPTLSFTTIDLTVLASLPDASTYTLNGVTFTAGSGNLSDAANPWGTGIALKVANTSGSILIQFSPSVTAFGAMFGFIGSGNSTLGLSGSGINESPYVNAATPVFLGAYSSTGFTNVLFESGNKQVALNSFVFSTTSTGGGGGGGAETPEPSTFAMIGTALIAFPLLARRKRRGSHPLPASEQ